MEFHCQKCKETPCSCGAQYEEWSLDRIRKFMTMLRQIAERKEEQEPSFGEEAKPRHCNYCSSEHAGNCRDYAVAHSGIYQDGSRISWEECSENFENDEDQVILVRCPVCSKKNRAENAIQGICTHCGYVARK